MVEEVEKQDALPPELKSVALKIIELQRRYYYEGANKDTERRKKLRSIIEDATPQGGSE